jgi:hypothetical protein
LKYKVKKLKQKITKLKYKITKHRAKNEVWSQWEWEEEEEELEGIFEEQKWDLVQFNSIESRRFDHNHLSGVIERHKNKKYARIQTIIIVS